MMGQKLAPGFKDTVLPMIEAQHWNRIAVWCKEKYSDSFIPIYIVKDCIETHISKVTIFSTFYPLQIFLT